MSNSTDTIKNIWIEQGEKVLSGENDASSAAALVDNLPEFVRFRTKSEINHLFRKYKFKDKTVLDIGCGPGRLSFKLASKSKYVYGIDFSPGFIRFAKNKQSELGIKNVSFHVSSVEDFKSKTKFDTVFIGGVLLYMTDIEIANLVKSIKQNILVPKGDIIIREPVSYLGHRETTSIDIKRTPSEYVDIIQNAGFNLKYENETFMHSPPFRFYQNLTTKQRQSIWNKTLFRILFTINGYLDPLFLHLGPEYKNRVTKNWTIKQKFFFFQSIE